MVMTLTKTRAISAQTFVDSISRKKLGEMLLEKGLISSWQLENALQSMRSRGGRIGQILVHEGIVREDDVTSLLGIQMNTSVVDLTKYNVQHEVIHLVPKELAHKYTLIPLELTNNNKLMVAMAFPDDAQAIRDLVSSTYKPVQKVIANESAIKKNIVHYYGVTLAERVSIGDSEAISEMISTYFDRIYRFIFHNVDRNQIIAEDIAQETFVHAFKSARTFRGDSNIYAWLVGIAYHKIGDYYRQLKQERQRGITSLDALAEYPVTLADGKQSFTDTIESLEDTMAIKNLLSTLTVHYGQALMLKYIEDLSVLEISGIMNRSPKSIEGLLARAKHVLRKNAYSLQS